jgi:hypothetical protein
MDRRARRNFIGLEQRGRAQRLRVKLAVHDNKSTLRLIRQQHDQGVRCPIFKALWHQTGSGMRRRQRIGIFSAFNEREIGRAGEVYWSDICNTALKSRSVTGFGASQRNDFGYRQARRMVKETAFPHFSILDQEMI